MNLLLSARRNVYDALSRLDEVNLALNAFLAVEKGAQHQDDDLSRKPNAAGPMHRVPVAIKDLIFVEGERTSGGSPIYRDFVAPFTATCVQRLKRAGAVSVGSTNLHELAYGVTSNNPHFGAVRNPHDPDRIPGGSSGGSGAAIAAGVVPIALGTDTGGSIRIPASYCGVVGLKPTYGLVSRHGVLPLGLSLDHVGPLAETVRDIAVTMEVLAGFDPLDPHSVDRPPEAYSQDLRADVQGVRVGIPENFFFEAVQPEVEDAVRSALEILRGLGAALVPVRVPNMDNINTAARIVLLAEASAIYEQYLDRKELFGDDVRSLIIQGTAVPATAYVNAQRLRGQYAASFKQIFERIDLLVTPTTPITAPLIGEEQVDTGGEQQDVRLATTRFVRAFNLLGLPAISLPCGFDSRRLPIGLQMVGKPFSEQLILNASQALESHWRR